MALIQETIAEEGTQFLYTYSDEGYLIRQNETGQLYTDAQDVIPCPYTYTETDQPIDPGDEDIYAEAGRILLGDE